MHGSSYLLCHAPGADHLYGGNGNDLLVSATTCDGDFLDGAEGEAGDGAAKNDASWAQLPEESGGTAVDLLAGLSGSAYVGGAPSCPSGSTDTLSNIDDVEGSSQRDLIYGDENPNLLIGHRGEDELFARGGEDTINSIDVAGSAEADVDGGGPGTDECIYDSLDTLNSCP